MSLFEEKIINSIVFFASKSPGGKINRLKLMKLLWLADRIHLNKYGRTVLRDKYCALPNGPIPTKAMNVSKIPIPNAFDVDGYNLETKGVFDPDYFSVTDLEVLNLVWERYGKFGQFELRDMSHLFPEWLRFEKELNDKSLPKSYAICMEDFFEAPKNVSGYEYNAEESNNSRIEYHAYTSILSMLTE